MSYEQSRLAAQPLSPARKRLKALEQEHAPRRGWVWSKLGRSPLAQAMAPLATLAEVTATPLAGAGRADMVHAYTEGGWRADRAVLEALAAVVTPQDRDAVSAVIAHVYQPWLRDAAELFQARVAEDDQGLAVEIDPRDAAELFQARVAADPVPGPSAPRLADVPAGTCVLFADGLRYDVGQMLKEQLEARVGTVAMAHHLAALPTVTPTAKPAVSPVAARITGTSAGEEFRPCLTGEGKDLTPDRFRNLTQRIEALLVAGWQEVRVVTDHGWLLMPRGLPKTDLPKYLTATRWRRCAVVKESATVDLPCFEWFWSESVRIASPPGIDCFVAGEDYNHGGLSLQECVVPQISVRGAARPATSASIEGVKWSGLRCRVKVAGAASGCRIDIRDKAAAPETSIADPKPVKDGNASVVVRPECDSREGTAATLVLLDASGAVLDKQAVTVGE